LEWLIKVNDMASWPAIRAMRWSAKAVVAAGLLAVLLVAAVPVALLVGVIMMLLGHAATGLALFGASVLAAVAAVGGLMIAGVSSVRHLRKLISRSDDRVVQLGRSEYHYD
jgi:hypothetical protein